jgi:hypothetical protein
MSTETEAALIVQVPRGGAVDRNWREDAVDSEGLPPSIASGQVLVERLEPEADGTLEPPEAGEIVMSVLSPEAFTSEPDEVRAVIDGAGPGEQALVILIEAAEYLREDELAVALDAANRSHRVVILRVMADA